MALRFGHLGAARVYCTHRLRRYATHVPHHPARAPPLGTGPREGFSTMAGRPGVSVCAQGAAQVTQLPRWIAMAHQSERSKAPPVSST